MPLLSPAKPYWTSDQKATPLTRNARYAAVPGAPPLITRYITTRMKAAEIGRSTE